MIFQKKGKILHVDSVCFGGGSINILFLTVSPREGKGMGEQGRMADQADEEPAAGTRFERLWNFSNGQHHQTREGYRKHQSPCDASGRRM